jgi:CRISPR-associated protein Csb3
MSASEPITIPVDLNNPGQFFACCGLLELADRGSAGVEGWFTNASFSITCAATARGIGALLKEFSEAIVEQLNLKDAAASPLRLLVRPSILLNWWCDENAGGKQLKPWAGKQFGPLIFRLMKQAVANAPTSATDSPLDYPAAVFDSKDGKARKKTISPFYFDSRRAGTSLDIGFSPDEQDMSVMAYPLVESLALVGLQRFRPYADESTHPRSFVFIPWAVPLPAAVAAAAVSGALAIRSCGAFRFTKPSRGGEYMTMFSRATRVRSNDVRN